MMHLKTFVKVFLVAVLFCGTAWAGTFRVHYSIGDRGAT
jgi:hypothetical protein